MKHKNNLRLLLDADSFIYKACSVSEIEIEFEPDQWFVSADLSQAKAMIANDIQGFKDQFKTDNILVALTDSHNWRLAYHRDYKRNRSKGRKPVGFKALKQWLKETYTCKQIYGLEADDILGIAMTGRYKGDQISISIDKDLATIPGKLYNPNRQYISHLPTTITSAEADYNHMFQTLVGDKVDNYLGCPGVGPIKAKQILNSGTGTLWEKVKQAYFNAGLTVEDAFSNAAAARILRYNEINMSTLELLWRPK